MPFKSSVSTATPITLYNPPMHLTAHDALLVIDMQNDFLLDGAPLQVHGGLDIIPGINALAPRFDHVLLTQDWHPAHHISFAATHGRDPFPPEGQAVITAPYGPQALWPDHCIQGTAGADLHSGLHLSQAELILRKGFRTDVDSYSAFVENDRITPTGLAGYLRERGLTRLFFTGVALDFCVGYSAIAASQLGFGSFVLEDLTAAVHPSSMVSSINQAFTKANVVRILTASL